MCLIPVNLVNETITNDVSNYPLKGMVSPTFQNDGNCDVIVDGRTLKIGQSFGVNLPNMVLQNSISIKFLSAIPADRILYVGYGRPIEEKF